MGKRFSKALSVFAGALLFVLVASTAAFALDPTPTNNGWRNYYDRVPYQTFSHLFTTPSGGLQRVEYVNDQLIVEDLSGENGAVTSKRVIDPSTYQPSDLDPEKFKWGGAFCGSSYNFVVTGQNNTNPDSDTLVIVRVTKYSKDWKYVSCCELAGINTSSPFYRCGCAFAEKDGLLYLRTDHLLPIGHTSVMMFVIDEQSMTSVLNGCYVWDIENTEWGFTSHSFNQKLTLLNDEVFMCDHADGSPRAIVIKKYGATGSSSYTEVLPISGEKGQNETGVSLGGFESSATRGTLLAAGNTVNQQTFAETGSTAGLGDNARLSRNIWLSVTSSDFSTSTIKMLTTYADDDQYSTCTPHLVKINEDRFLVMWNRRQVGTKYYPLEYETTSTMNYVFVDGMGNLLSKVATVDAVLSDCHPVVFNGRVIWYSASTSSESVVPTYYAIDAQTGAFTSTAKPKTGWVYDKGAYYYYETNGTMRKNNWASYKGVWYYLGADGKVVVNGWGSYGGKWYYLGSNGKVVVNDFAVYGNNVYYMGSNGQAVVNQWKKVGGVWYHFNAKGVCDRQYAG